MRMTLNHHRQVVLPFLRMPVRLVAVPLCIPFDATPRFFIHFELETGP